MKHQSVYRNWFFINQATGNQLAQEQDKGEFSVIREGV